MIELEKMGFARRSFSEVGGLAQLARALALHARGHRFDSVILHWSLRKRSTEKNIVGDIDRDDQGHPCLPAGRGSTPISSTKRILDLQFIYRTQL